VKYVLHLGHCFRNGPITGAKKPKELRIMKKSLSLLMTVFMIFALFGVVSAGLTDGLVAYYPFNGNAADESGNGNDGTVFGATLTEDRNGNSNSAYRFDGIDDWIKVENSPSVNIHGDTSLSISAWIRPNTLGQIQHIVNKWGPGMEEDDQYSISVLYDKLNFGLSDEPTYIVSHSTVPEGLWTYVTGVYDYDEGKIRVFINGSLDNEMEILFSITDTERYIEIGRHHDCLYYFLGDIDEIRIYNRALSESEIQTLYNGATAKLTISPPSGAYVTTQRFDIALILEAPGLLSVVGGNAKLNGFDVTSTLAHCLIPGILISGGCTFRCPGLSGSTFGTGTHTLEVSLDLSDGSSVNDSVIWEVKENAESKRIRRKRDFPLSLAD
jgi:hypothetical protein